MIFCDNCNTNYQGDDACPVCGASPEIEEEEVERDEMEYPDAADVGPDTMYQEAWEDKFGMNGTNRR